MVATLICRRGAARYTWRRVAELTRLKMHSNHRVSAGVKRFDLQHSRDVAAQVRENATASTWRFEMTTSFKQRYRSDRTITCETSRVLFEERLDVRLKFSVPPTSKTSDAPVRRNAIQVLDIYHSLIFVSEPLGWQSSCFTWHYWHDKLTIPNH